MLKIKQDGSRRTEDLLGKTDTSLWMPIPLVNAVGEEQCIMELNQLRYFKVLAETGSLSKAAEKLYITPPALSACLARLEREVGTPLFDRARTLVLNEKGAVFLEYVTQSLAVMDNAQRAIDEMCETRDAQLTVGVASAVVWNNLFLDFLKAYPNINLEQKWVSLDEMSNERILNEFDFIIAAPEDLSTENLHSVVLYDDDRPTLMVSADHPLAQTKSVTLYDVKDEGFVALSKGTSSRRYFDMMFSVAGFAPRIVVECSPQMRRAFVLEGRGIALVTAHTMEQNQEPGIRFVEITAPVYRRSQALYWHAKRYQTQAARTFRTFAVEYFKNGSFNKRVP